MSYNKDEVKELIEIEDVYTLLEYLDAEPQQYSDYLICKTICHNGDSHKLYYYSDSQLFHCYTGNCNSFDIFELIQKTQDIDDLNAAVYYIVHFFNLMYKLNEEDNIEYDLEDYQTFKRYNAIKDLMAKVNEEKQELQYKHLDNKILQYYPKLEIADWTKEGISKEVCDYVGISYDALDGNILIPHKDENGNLIGIRQRALVKENEKYGKYRPWKQGKELYNHALSFNLYGLDMAKDKIQTAGLAIVFESEKSVLKYISYFGLANDLAVAVCGNNLSAYQFSLLRKYGAKEVVIAFDRDYEDDDQKKQIELEKKLENIYNRFGHLVNMSFLYDAERNILGYKESPIDKGKDIFLYMFRNRTYYKRQGDGLSEI